MTPNAIAALCVGALAMIAASCLQAFTGHVPSELWLFASAGLSGGLGIAIPTTATRRGPPPPPP